MSVYRVFLDVEQEVDGWTVRVVGEGGQFARVHTEHLDMSLRMAEPYIATLCQPDPFAHMLEGFKP